MSKRLQRFLMNVKNAENQHPERYARPVRLEKQFHMVCDIKFYFIVVCMVYIIYESIHWRKNMITCNVCGHLNPLGALICENCGSDLSDSPDYGVFDEDDEFF